MTTPPKTLVERLPRQQAGGTDVVHVAGAVEEQWRLWVEGEPFPRVVLDVYGSQVLIGPGSIPPTPIASGSGAPVGASYITLQVEAGLSNESQLGTVIRRDVIANRGAFGNPGVLFLATDTLIGYRDSGTSWDPAFPVLNGSGQIAGAVLPNTAVTPGAYGTANGMKLGTFTVGADGRLTAAATVSIPRIIQVAVTDPAVVFGTGVGVAYVRINSLLNGGKITAVAAQVNVASGVGKPTVAIQNVTQAVAVLSTNLTIDAGALDSNGASVPAVINGANNTVNTGDELRIDIPAAGSGAQGLIVEITVTP